MPLAAPRAHGGRLGQLVCVDLQGETVSELAGFDLEETGFGVAARIAEQVPAPEGTRRKLVLPSCQLLAGGHLEAPLRDLFELSQVGVSMRPIGIQFGPRIRASMTAAIGSSARGSRAASPGTTRPALRQDGVHLRRRHTQLRAGGQPARAEPLLFPVSAALLGRLDEISRHLGGQVPLHGRLSAPWSHHTYPRGFSFPPCRRRNEPDDT